MTDAILAVTDGITRVDLINPSSGFHLISWDPAITDYKGGGVFQNPPLADWRQLRVGKWETAIESMGLHINGANPNGAATILQELRQLLEKANQYWTTDWQNTPVWLEAKAKCETNIRYTIIVKGRLASDRNYFDQPFTGQIATMQSLPLQIERRAWQSDEPGSKTAVQQSNETEYNSISQGRSATSGNDIFRANKRSIANLTNIHITTGGANLINAATPFTILDISALDSTYFGIDTSLSNSGPFDNIVFDIGTARVGGTVTWEYWSGAAWVGFPATTLQDNTSGLGNTGVSSVNFVQPSNWATNTPGGALPTGYWVRLRVTVVGTTDAVQQNRNIYSQNVPYTEIDLAQVAGDISALGRLTTNYLLHDGSNVNTDISKVMLSIRSNSRGVTGFTPYINFSDEQNPSGITIFSITSSFTTLTEYPTGRALRLTIGGAGSATVEIGSVIVGSSIAVEYYGTYRAFLRFGAVSSSFSSLTVQIDLGDASGLSLFQSEVKDIPTSTSIEQAIDMGELKIYSDASRENPGGFIISVDVTYTATGATNLTIADLVLMPTDEWSAELDAPGKLSNLKYIDADSIRQKKVIEALTRLLSDDTRNSIVNTINNGPIILQNNTTQRLYSFAQNDRGSDVFSSPFAALSQGQLWKTSRYFSLRGDE